MHLRGVATNGIHFLAKKSQSLPLPVTIYSLAKNELVRGADTELDSVQKVYRDNWEAL